MLWHKENILVHTISASLQICIWKSCLNYSICITGASLARDRQTRSPPNQPVPVGSFQAGLTEEQALQRALALSQAEQSNGHPQRCVYKYFQWYDWCSWLFGTLDQRFRYWVLRHCGEQIITLSYLIVLLMKIYPMRIQPDWSLLKSLEGIWLMQQDNQYPISLCISLNSEKHVNITNYIVNYPYLRGLKGIKYCGIEFFSHFIHSFRTGSREDYSQIIFVPKMNEQMKIFSWSNNNLSQNYWLRNANPIPDRKPFNQH